MQDSLTSLKDLFCLFLASFGDLAGCNSRTTMLMAPPSCWTASWGDWIKTLFCLCVLLEWYLFLQVGQGKYSGGVKNAYFWCMLSYPLCKSEKQRIILECWTRPIALFVFVLAPTKYCLNRTHKISAGIKCGQWFSKEPTPPDWVTDCEAVPGCEKRSKVSSRLSGVPLGSNAMTTKQHQVHRYF